MIEESHAPLPLRAGMPERRDYEYERAGTCNLFVAVEPKGGRRTVLVTDHRAKADFVAFVQYLLEQVYAKARRVHLVMDNLNTHFRKCFDDVLGVKRAKVLLRRVVFHYTPKHASWLNMAEIEIGILDRQCLDRRLPNRNAIVTEVDAWQLRRNTDQRGIAWSFTRQDAEAKLADEYGKLVEQREKERIELAVKLATLLKNVPSPTEKLGVVQKAMAEMGTQLSPAERLKIVISVCVSKITFEYRFGMAYTAEPHTGHHAPILFIFPTLNELF